MRRAVVAAAVLVVAAGGITAGMAATRSSSPCAGSGAASARLEGLARDPAAAAAFFDPAAGSRVADVLTRHLSNDSGLPGLPSCASVGDALRSAAIGTADLPGDANRRVGHRITQVLDADLDATVPAPMQRQITDVLIAYAPFGDLSPATVPSDGSSALVGTPRLMAGLAGDPGRYARLLAGVLTYADRLAASYPTADARVAVTTRTAETVADLTLALTGSAWGKSHPNTPVTTVDSIRTFLRGQSRPTVSRESNGRLTPAPLAPLLAAADHRIGPSTAPTVAVENLHDRNEQGVKDFAADAVRPTGDDGAVAEAGVRAGVAYSGVG